MILIYCQLVLRLRLIVDALRLIVDAPYTPDWW
jgi:hypothetical protein